MKKTFQIMIVTCLTIAALNVHAKGIKGVYLTASDYAKKKISYETGCKIHLNNSVCDMPYITIMDHGKKQKLYKSEIFGYVDGGNRVFRFYKNTEYLIAEAGAINIYLRPDCISQSKGFKVIKSYYFSPSPEGEIIPLTWENLQKAYKSNNKFIDLLEQFLSNGDVTVYDNVHNTYRVNYVYSK